MNRKTGYGQRENKFVCAQMRFPGTKGLMLENVSFFQEARVYQTVNDEPNWHLHLLKSLFLLEKWTFSVIYYCNALLPSVMMMLSCPIWLYIGQDNGRKNWVHVGPKLVWQDGGGGEMVVEVVIFIRHSVCCVSGGHWNFSLLLSYIDFYEVTLREWAINSIRCVKVGIKM